MYIYWIFSRNRVTVTSPNPSRGSRLTARGWRFKVDYPFLLKYRSFDSLRVSQANHLFNLRPRTLHSPFQLQSSNPFFVHSVLSDFYPLNSYFVRALTDVMTLTLVNLACRQSRAHVWTGACTVAGFVRETEVVRNFQLAPSGRTSCMQLPPERKRSRAIPTRASCNRFTVQRLRKHPATESKSCRNRETWLSLRRKCLGGGGLVDWTLADWTAMLFGQWKHRVECAREL